MELYKLNIVFYIINTRIYGKKQDPFSFHTHQVRFTILHIDSLEFRLLRSDFQNATCRVSIWPIYSICP